MINYIRGITRSYDYAKVKGADNEDDYQAAMVITRETAPGRSFWITRDAIWKYIDPSDNREERTIASDRQEFAQIVDSCLFALRISVTPQQRQQVVNDSSCIVFARALNGATGIMLCTGYNLAKCMQMFNLSPVPAAAAQLLLWIQDGLDQLKNMPDNPPAEDTRQVIGEVTLFNGGDKIGSRDISVAESDLIMEAE